ncbi:MAG TPA: FmdB family zinc ribbon protein [Natronosporangium sp.]
MPTYQYACTACDHRLEAVQSFSDDPLTQCPECNGRLRKLYNSVGVVFKGPGFYRTDSRNGASGANGSKSNGSSGDSSAKDSGTSKDSGSDKSKATASASAS